MVKTNGLLPFPTLVVLEERAAAIILNAVNEKKTEQDTLKALKAAAIDVRRLPRRFVSTRIEENLKAARAAANALRIPRKKKAST
jgi:hypothetical protein